MLSILVSENQHTELTVSATKTVYRARTEPQIRYDVHGCDNIDNVVLGELRLNNRLEKRLS